MAGLIVIGAVLAGQKGYEAVQARRERRKARKLAGLPADPADGATDEDDELAAPPAYHQLGAASGPSAPAQTRASQPQPPTVRHFDTAPASLPPRTRLDEVHLTATEGVLTIGKGSHIGTVVSAGSVVLEADVVVDTLQATGGVSLGKDCRVSVLRCGKDAQLAKRARVELANVGGQVVAHEQAVVVKRE